MPVLKKSIKRSTSKAAKKTVEAEATEVAIVASAAMKRKIELLDRLAAAGTPRDPRKCVVFMKKQDRYCERWSIAGGTVCIKHGGKAPQVMKAAKARMLELVDSRISRLEELSDQNDHMPSALGATLSILNRALGKVGEGPSQKGSNLPTINIGINLTGKNTVPEVTVLSLTPGKVVSEEDTFQGEDSDIDTGLDYAEGDLEDNE